MREVTATLGTELYGDLEAVTLEEFRLTELRYVTDLRLGQELLYLLSNSDWARRSTELLDVSRIAAVETRITVDVDTSHIVHEALRTIDGPLWLPLFTLPSGVPDADLGRQAIPPADPPIGVDVIDAQGVRVAGVPQAEVRRHLAAALAETLVARLNRQSDSARHQYERQHQVLLAAALAQLLTRSPGDAPRRAGANGASEEDSANHVTRLGRARVNLLTWLVRERKLPESASVLASREAEIVHALRGSTLVVVPVKRVGPPTSFTMVMPTRPLLPSSRRAHASAVEFRIALLAPTTHADRVIEMQLPAGVRVRSGADPRLRPEALVEVATLPQFEQLRRLVDWIVRGDARHPKPTGWSRKQLAELAGTKLEAAVQCLLHHYDSYEPDPDAEHPDPEARKLVPTTDTLVPALRRLRAPLSQLANLSEPAAGSPPELQPDQWAAKVAELWPDLDGRLSSMRLRRRLNRSTTTPGSVRFRASAIEEFTQRAQPTQAHIRLQVEAGPSPVLGTARAVNAINVMVLFAVAVLLVIDPLDPDRNSSRAEVLAAVLTIFPTIQASRLRQPDSTELAGLLTMGHFTAGLFTAVPGLVLAGFLAFEPDGGWTKAVAVGAVLLQLGCAAWIRFLRRLPSRGRAAWLAARVRRLAALVPGRSRLAPLATRLRRSRLPTRLRRSRVGRRLGRIGGPLGLRTARSPAHARFDVLQAAWCRSLTGDVLLIGRTAHPYVVVDTDGPGTFGELLTGSQGSPDELAALAELTDPPGSGGFGPAIRRMISEVAALTRSADRTADQPAPAEQADHLVNLIGVLRGTAVDRSATFLIFREPPQRGWDASAGSAGEGLRRITRLDLDRVRPAPMEPPDWVIDVMVGFARDGQDPVDQHPLARVAAAAKRSQFTPVNVQFPAPPLQGSQPRQWLRVRVGVPFRQGDSLSKLVGFLSVLQEMRAQGLRVHLREVPQMESLDATQTAPEDSFDAPPGSRLGRDDVGEPTGELVTDVELQVPEPDAAQWRLVAVCAPPRAGLVADSLAALAREGRVRSLAGAISGVLNGTAVMFLLCAADGADPVDPEEIGGRLAAHPTLAEHSALVTVLPGVPPRDPRSDPPRALLRVQIRTPDRPGVLQDLLRELAAEIEREVPVASGRDGDRPAPAVDVLYTLTPVVDGQAISGRMLVRLPDRAGGPTGWAGVTWADVGRRIERSVGRQGGSGLADAERTARRSDDTEVKLELVRRAYAAEPAGTARPAR